MDFNTRKVAHYLEVTALHNGTYIDLGFHDVDEAKVLLKSLSEVVSDLEWFIQTEEK